MHWGNATGSCTRSIVAMADRKAKPKKKPLTRSENMARIRSRDTAPELRLRKALWAAGVRYRLHADLPGKPDIVLPRAKVAVFVDGCFWHSCPVHGTSPKTNTDYWRPKLERNRERDARADTALRELGWLPLRLFDHEIGDPADGAAALVLAAVKVRLQ